MMHMTFYVGNAATILFDGWTTPADNPGPLIGSCLALMAMAILYQWLLSFRFEREVAVTKLRNSEMKSLLTPLSGDHKSYALIICF